RIKVSTRSMIVDSKRISNRPQWEVRMGFSMSRLDRRQRATLEPIRPGGAQSHGPLGPAAADSPNPGRRSGDPLAEHILTASLPVRPDSIDPRVPVRRSRDWFARDHSGTLTATPSPDRRDTRAGRRIDRATPRGWREARNDRLE